MWTSNNGARRWLFNKTNDRLKYQDRSQVQQRRSDYEADRCISGTQKEINAWLGICIICGYFESSKRLSCCHYCVYIVLRGRRHAGSSRMAFEGGVAERSHCSSRVVVAIQWNRNARYGKRFRPKAWRLLPGLASLWTINCLTLRSWICVEHGEII